LGTWSYAGFGVYGPHPIYGKMVGRQVGKKKVKYGSAESKPVVSSYKKVNLKRK
jgi:hypothetical protein